MSSDGPASVHNICGVSPKVRALASSDLDSHVSFIRKSLAAGMSCREIGERLGVPGHRIEYYADKMRMVRKRRQIPSQKEGSSGSYTSSPLTASHFRAVRKTTDERAPNPPHAPHGARAAEPAPIPGSAAPSFADPPFACPLDAVIDLPAPPSVNALWRHKRGPKGRTIVYRSARYKRWLGQADMAVIAARTYRDTPKMAGPFEAEILLSSRGRRMDADNACKGILDWAQSRGFIRNDKDAVSVAVRWVTPDQAPAGARLILRPSEGI